jgi:hypothetical protein
MLNYSINDETAKSIAIYYSRKIDNSLAEEFFNGTRSLSNSDEALELARVFWEITDLASTDHLNNISILDNEDLEFWMHKLFNKLYGYYERNGFKEQWKMAEKENGA